MASSPTEMSVFERVADRGSFSGTAEDTYLISSARGKYWELEILGATDAAELRQPA